MVRIERREIHDVFDTLVRNEVEQFLRRRAVRIDERNTLPILDILYRHIFEHGRFTHTRLADDVYVLSSIYGAYAEHLAFASRVRRRKISNAAVIIPFIGIHAPYYTSSLNDFLLISRTVRGSRIGNFSGALGNLRNRIASKRSSSEP